MVTVNLNKFELLKLLEANGFTIDNILLSETFCVIEREASFKLVKSVSTQLRQDIKSKYASLKAMWNRANSSAEREKIRTQIRKQLYTIKIAHMDIIADSVVGEFTAYKERIQYLEKQNQTLDTNLKHLKSEVKVLNEQLERRVANGTTEADKKTFKKLIANKKFLKGKHNIKRLQHVQDSLSLIKHEKRKNYFECSERQKMRLRNSIKKIFLESSDFLRNMGLCLNSIELNPIELDECDVKLKIKTIHDDLNDEYRKYPNVNKMLYYKDKFSISDKSYCGLKSKCNLDIPSLYMIKQRRAEIDSQFQIHRNKMGVFVSFKDKLTQRLRTYFERKYGEEFLIKNEADVKLADFEDHIVHVKLAADGTNIGRTLKLLNFTFTILNEGLRARTATGNYTLGIYEIESENYDSIKVCFKEIIDEIRNLNELQLDTRTIKIVYYYAGDWKMLAHSLGLLSANSKYPCVWCKCCKEDFADSSQEWSIENYDKGARNHDEIKELIEQKSTKALKYGHAKTPIFEDIIPINRYMIDMLHLFLRISDTLINLIIKDCSYMDKFESWNVTKFTLTDYKHLKAFEVFLNEKCSVHFKFLWLAETKKLTWRDLVGPEKIRVFENFDLAQIIPKHDKFDLVSQLWKDFYTILCDVKNVRLDAAQVKERTRAWLDLFLVIYNKITITPYMHAFVHHLHEFVALYKDINAFNLQGLERLNDLSTGQYFKGTNKRDNAFEQMLKKRNRMEYLRLFVDDTDLND